MKSTGDVLILVPADWTPGTKKYNKNKKDKKRGVKINWIFFLCKTIKKRKLSRGCVPPPGVELKAECLVAARSSGAPASAAVSPGRRRQQEGSGGVVVSKAGFYVALQDLSQKTETNPNKTKLK